MYVCDDEGSLYQADRMGKTVNSMVRQLTTFANEVTRVALEVGTQGILGGQAVVEGVEGVWADLTTNVNVRRITGPGKTC